jgi:predicted Zn-dependent protease
VWEGLLTRTRQDDDMLAGVLAHELAHLHHRHFLEQVKLVALLHALFGAWARSWPRLLIRNTVKRLVFTGYNHGREHQADATAVDILVRADFDPVGLLRVFHALQEGAPPVGMTGTHPNTSDRIERVAEVLRARGGSHADHAPRTVLDFPGSKEPS